MPGTLSAQTGTPDSRPAREKETASWVVGVVLILAGLVFLLENAGYLTLSGNWWALFIYLAAFASFANAFRSYRATARFGSTATGSLVWGLVLVTVATILIFNLLWEVWWPAILVAVGIGIVIGGLLGRGEQDDRGGVDS